MKLFQVTQAVKLKRDTYGPGEYLLWDYALDDYAHPRIFAQGFWVTDENGAPMHGPFKTEEEALREQ